MKKAKITNNKLYLKIKKRIEIIREQLKELGYKVLRDKLKEIKKRLYIVENKKGLLG